MPALSKCKPRKRSNVERPACRVTVTLLATTVDFSLPGTILAVTGITLDCAVLLVAVTFFTLALAVFLLVIDLVFFSLSFCLGGGFLISHAVIIL